MLGPPPHRPCLGCGRGIPPPSPWHTPEVPPMCPYAAPTRCLRCSQLKPCACSTSGWNNTRGQTTWAKVKPVDRRRWRKARKVFLRGHPYCMCLGCGHCLPNGCAALADQVDHIHGAEAVLDPARIAEEEEMQSLCEPCHVQKTTESSHPMGGRITGREA